MRAMILKHPAPVEDDPLELVDVPLPVPKPHEILVKIVVCGICHTDLHTVEGELPLKKKQIIPGHQVVGVVTKTGNKAKLYTPGDVVGIAWLHSTCGLC